MVCARPHTFVGTDIAAAQNGCMWAIDFFLSLLPWSRVRSLIQGNVIQGWENGIPFAL